MKGRREPASAAPRVSIACVFLSSGPVIREVVDESGVDYAVGSSRATAQALDIIKRAAMHIGSCRSERLGARIGASKAEHFVTRLQQLRDDGRTDEACSTCNENFHKCSFFVIEKAKLSKKSN